MQTVQREPASREERAGCEPGMSVPAYRNEQIAAGRCPRRRSRNGRGAAGRAALAVPSSHAAAASGKRPQALPSAPRPVRNRHRHRDKNRGRSRAARAGPAARPRQPMADGAEALHHRGRIPLAAARCGHAPRRPHPRSRAGVGEGTLDGPGATKRGLLKAAGACFGFSRLGWHRTTSWGCYTRHNQVFVAGDGPALAGIQGRDTRERLQAASGKAQAGQDGAFPYQKGHTCPRLPGEEAGAPGLSVFEAFGQCPTCCDKGQPGLG